MTDDEGGELLAGVRPALLEEGRPQGKLEWHAGIGYEIVQKFDVPVPQMMEHLPNILQFFAALSPVPEQVIAVPKILPHDVPPRRVCRDTQLAEQLVEVPTILTPSFLRMLQNVDTPVPHGGRGASGGLQGFLPGHFSSAPVEQTVDIPAPRSGVRRLQGFLPEQSATSFGEADHFPAASVEQIVDFPVSGGGLQDLRHDRVLRHPLTLQLILRMTCFKGFFALFPETKKVRHNLRTRGRHCLRTQAHGRRLLMTRPWCLKEEEESEDELVEYVQHDGRWWGCEWVPARQRHCWPGWPYYLAASMAHRQRARVTMPRWCFSAGSWFDSGYLFQLDFLWRCLFQFIVKVVDTALIYKDRYTQCQTVQGRRLPCHGAEDVSLGLMQQTTEISQLQSIDTLVVVVVQVLQFGYTP